MAFPKKISQLCSPAAFYFILSMIAYIFMVFQNIGEMQRYHLGIFSVPVESTFLIFVVQLIYILFWTYVLNLICKDGNKWLSWLLILFPFILFFVLIFLFLFA